MQSQAAPRVLCGLCSHRQPHVCCVVYAVTGSPTCAVWSMQSQAAPQVVCGLCRHRQPHVCCVVYAVTGSLTCGVWSMQSQAASHVVCGLCSHRQPHVCCVVYAVTGSPMGGAVSSSPGDSPSLPHSWLLGARTGPSSSPSQHPPTPLRHPGPRGFPPRPAASGLSLTPATTALCFCCEFCSCVEMNHFVYGYLG